MRPKYTTFVSDSNYVNPMKTRSDSNLTVAPNVWIDADNPEITPLWKLMQEIPGDLMVDFIAHENPLINPREMRILNERLTAVQMEEYKVRRFFLNQGEQGAAFEPSAGRIS